MKIGKRRIGALNKDITLKINHDRKICKIEITCVINLVKVNAHYKIAASTIALKAT